MTDQENFHQYKVSQPIIHRAPWVIMGMKTESQGPAQRAVEDGALVVADGLIQAVGRYRDIKKEFGLCQIREHASSILTPALINSHCHLELSHLNIAKGIKGRKAYNGDITKWIRDLLSARERFFHDNDDAERLILQQAGLSLQHMSDEGVAFIGDIGNSLASRTIGTGQNTRVYFLLELLGLTRNSEVKTFARLENIDTGDTPAIGCTPHAPYSTTSAVIKALKRRAAEHGHILSIHVAESLHEVEFLKSGAGEFREFLLERGAWDGSFTFPAKGSVQYLDSLDVIDSRTICVHSVHVDKTEIDILAKNKAKVCLCPGSNRFLGVGKAPVTEFLDHGILPALGTDSKASNESLSMWREMLLLREDYHGLLPERVFAMATCGGAEAWGISSAMGSLEPGKLPRILAVKNNEKIDSPKVVFDFLTTASESVQVDWLG